MPISGREAIETVFQRRLPERPVVCIRLEQWYKAAQSANALPAEVADKSVEEVALHLGFAVAARFGHAMQVELPGRQRVEQGKDGTIVTAFELPGRTLTSVSRMTDDMAAAGMGAHPVKYPVESDDDCLALTEAWKEARLSLREKEFCDFDAQTGETGLPMQNLGACPAHYAALNYFGYEGFYLALAESPSLVEGLIRAMDQAFREQMWPLAEQSASRLILHGTHFSETMNPPPIFEQYFAPYFADFNAKMRAAGKWVCFHGDSDLGKLTPRVSELGFDGADCLATAPLVKETLEDYLSVWRGRVVAWGGLPSVAFAPTFPDAAYRELVEQAVSVAQGRNDVILGSGDIVMPGAPWERLKFLAEMAK